MQQHLQRYNEKFIHIVLQTILYVDVPHLCELFNQSKKLVKAYLAFTNVYCIFSVICILLISLRLPVFQPHGVLVLALR